MQEKFNPEYFILAIVALSIMLIGLISTIIGVLLKIKAYCLNKQKAN